MIDPQDIREALQALRRQREAIGAGVVDVAVSVLADRLAELEKEPTLDVRRQLATVLFADVSGFTAMSEDLDPEEVRDVMNTVWQRVDGIIVEHGGSIDKHIGDAVMALFGVPRAKEDDAIQAVRCGLAMQVALAELSAAGLLEGRPALGMRVGIHTGQVVFGVVGTTGERTVLGDTVNLAARLESAAKVGGVLVSDETWQGLRRSFSGAPRKPMVVKGRSAPVQTWEVEAETGQERQFDAGGPSSVRESPFVGRLTELAVLLEAGKAAIDEGRVRYVTILGEAGTGKSRLCYELRRRLAESGLDFDLFVGRMPQQESRAPYEILRAQLFERYGVRETDTAAQAMGKLRTNAQSLSGADGEARAAIIGHIIGFDCSDHPAVAELVSEPRRFQEAAFQAVKAMIEDSASRKPLVMLFEDLQWAADASLDLADWLLEHCQELPILCVHAIRPTLFERRPNWATRVVNQLRIELAPLSPKEADRLAGHLLSGVVGAGKALRDRLVTASGGNPYFLEELVRKLADDGVIVASGPGGQWEVAPERLATMRVPATLSAVIAARLDALPRAERRALERAAVVGQRFWDAMVRVLDPDDADPGEALANLVERDLIREDPGSAVAGAREFHFRSALVRDAAYERVLLKFRAEAHGRAALWLESQGATYVQAHAREIAEHWARAGEPVASAGWRLRASKLAKATGALEDALREVEAAERELAAADAGGPIRLEVLLSVGLLAAYGRRYEQAVEAYNAVVTRAEADSDGLAQAKGLAGLSSVARLQGRYGEALEHADRSVTLADAHGATEVASDALIQGGWSRSWLGRHDESRDAARRALELSEAGGDTLGQVAALRLLGNLALIECDYPVARRYLEDAVRLAVEAGQRLVEGRAHNDFGEYYRLRGEYGEATRRYTLALEAFSRSGDLDGVLLATTNHAGTRLHLGPTEAAEAEAVLVRLRAKAGDQWYAAAEAQRHLAEALVVQGAGEEAIDAAWLAYSMAQDSGSAEDLVPSAATLLDACRVGGVVDERTVQMLMEAYEGAIAASQARSMDADRGRLLRSYAAWSAWVGRNAQAERAAEQARGLFDRLGLTEEAARSALGRSAPPPVGVGP